jgi:hypothetical protein
LWSKANEEQLLLNIVRLRHNDTPSGLAVSAIATQFELLQNLSIVPFFTSSGADINQNFTSLLSQATADVVSRMTAARLGRVPGSTRHLLVILNCLLTAGR